MRILYLSNLNDESFAGLTYSVPAQIAAQSHYDEVHWYNFKPVERKSWRDHDFYHNANDYKFEMSKFQKQYWTPDLIVFEGFYAFHPGPRLLSILNSGIPYVIVPRCTLTRGDQGKKAAKKKMCNALFYRRFARGASAIHYLTKQEMQESGMHWNESYFIAPNGIVIDKSCTPRIEQPQQPVKIVYIGRLEPYQKGLDVLLDAICGLKRNDCLDGFTLSLYGNSVDGSAKRIKEFIFNESLEGSVAVYPPVFDDEKVRILKLADIFLLTSRYEGMPMGLLEACSLGIPSIVTPGTHLADDIERENAGWVCNLNADSIAQTIHRAVNETSEFPLKSAGARSVANRYAWDAIASSTHAEYARLVLAR